MSRSKKVAPRQSDRERKRLEAIAHHEAGHAVVAQRHRIAFTEVTIIPKPGEYAGRVHHSLSAGFFRRLEDAGLSPRVLEAHALVCFAGAEAEKRFSGRYNHAGARHDHNSAIELIGRHAGSQVGAKRVA